MVTRGLTPETRGNIEDKRDYFWAHVLERILVLVRTKAWLTSDYYQQSIPPGTKQYWVHSLQTLRVRQLLATIGGSYVIGEHVQVPGATRRHKVGWNNIACHKIIRRSYTKWWRMMLRYYTIDLLAKVVGLRFEEDLYAWTWNLMLPLLWWSTMESVLRAISGDKNDEQVKQIYGKIHFKSSPIDCNDFS